MGTILREAGWPVWLVLASGSYGLIQAVRWRLGSGSASEVIGAVFVTLMTGVWATVWAAQMAFGSLPDLTDPAKEGWLAWVGIKEGLYNLDIACALAIAAALVATVGRRRDAVASSG